MTATGSPSLRVLTFGRVDGSLWGAAVGAGAAGLVIGDGGATAAVELAPDGWQVDDQTWRLAGGGCDLRVQSLAPEPASADASARPEVTGRQELCRVRGVVTHDGAERQIDCVGARTELDGVDPGALASLRAVGGWFADDEAIALLALRRARTPGQESDLIAATLFDPDGWVPVSDPRLSTTYTGDGVPTRVNLELWVGDGEHEFPRRAAGEAAAAAAGLRRPGLDVRAVPLRCHSHGREGAGVYLLATV